MTAVIIESGNSVISEEIKYGFVTKDNPVSVIPEIGSAGNVLVSIPDPIVVNGGQVGPAGKDGSSAGPKSPVFTYGVSGELVRIDYADSSYKTFTWVSEKLTQTTYVAGSVAVIKQFLYNPDGTLSEIVET